MSPALDLHDLLSYTTWQRGLWQAWFEKQGPAALAVTTGPHGDGRFPRIGGLIRHIFSAELRYAERITRVPLTDTASVSTDDATALFQFGAMSRARFVHLIGTLPAAQWDVPLDFPLLNSTVRASPRKIVLHVLTHEIRHWAQVATLLRLQGQTGDRQDLSSVPSWAIRFGND